MVVVVVVCVCVWMSLRPPPPPPRVIGYGRYNILTWQITRVRRGRKEKRKIKMVKRKRWVVLTAT